MGGSSATDPYFSNVSLLLHGDGANGSTAIIDSSASPKTMTVSGAAKISTAQSLAGGSSIHIDGTSGAKVQTPTGSAFAFTADFTFELFVRLVNAGSNPDFLNVDGQASAHQGHGVGINSSGKFYGLTAASSNPASVSAAYIFGTTTAANGVWYHIAFTRAGNVYRLFVDGVQEATTTSATAVAGPTGNNFILGQYFNDTERFNGYMEEVRFTRGVARYAANFTPPTAPLPSA